MTYAGQQGQLWEVLQRLQSASVQADEFKLGELFEVGLVIGCQPLNYCLVEDQIVELIDNDAKWKGKELVHTMVRCCRQPGSQELLIQMSRES